MAFTFFFRDHHTIHQMITQLLPLIDGFRRVNIWDAGCANGPEPYTLAIMLAERMGHFAFKNLYIDATDIDESDTFGKIINEGVYNYEELKRIPEDIFAKYFTPADKKDFFIISENIRNRIHFTKNDLLKFQPVGNNYSLIVCKNVLLHFQPEQRVEVIKMYHSVMAQNGIFITEQTQQLPDECQHLFTKMITDANIFQKK
ncbi:MAG: chemotaxis protein methyltransferase CheR [Bacteroidota bacterium]|nr:chemotaxis protein methyltransferase CheR [Bacteroidota bacterium]